MEDRVGGIEDVIVISEKVLVPLLKGAKLIKETATTPTAVGIMKNWSFKNGVLCDPKPEKTVRSEPSLTFVIDGGKSSLIQK